MQSIDKTDLRKKQQQASRKWLGNKKHMPADLCNIKRVDPYLWTQLAHVLEGSGSRRRHPRKGTNVDRVCVIFVARVDRQIFLLFVKNGFVVGARSLNVTAGHWNDTFFWREHPIVSVKRMARRYTIQCSLPNTRTVYVELDGRGQAGREGWRMGGREQGEEVRKRWCEGGWEEWKRVEEGNEWGREESGRKGDIGREGDFKGGTLRRTLASI